MNEEMREFNSVLNTMEEVFRHIYGDQLVDQMIAEIIEDAKAAGQRLAWNELSRRLKPYRKFPTKGKPE